MTAARDRRADLRSPGAALRRFGAVALLGAAATAAPAVGQGPNYVLPPSQLETRLADEPFQIVEMRDNRWQGDRTQQTVIRFRDGLEMRVKWARAAPGGFAINNQPRYEVAAYELQKLFLDEPDWVVPPTVMRELPLAAYRQIDPEIQPTFEGTGSVLVAVQYWLRNVEAAETPDTARMRNDDAYARHLGTLNLFTYLIRHVDSNPGNVLVSSEGEPHLYAVDNGVAFRSPVSPRGTAWRDLRADRVPADAVDRLRGLTRAVLEDALYVVAQFRLRDDGRLEQVATTPKRDENRGVDFEDGVVQLGLTNLEMDGVWERIQEVLRRVDAGELETF